MFCPNCGKEQNDSPDYCYSCGAKLTLDSSSKPTKSHVNVVEYAGFWKRFAAAMKEIIVIQLNKQTLASFVMGCIGAAIGGFLGYSAFTAEGEEIQPIIPAYIVFIVGLTSGFLSCFYCSKIFLKLIQDKSWLYGIPLALIFGVLAGGISGFLTGFSWAPPAALFGIFFGSIIGLVVSLVSWLIFGHLVFPFLVKAPDSSV